MASPSGFGWIIPPGGPLLPQERQPNIVDLTTPEPAQLPQPPILGLQEGVKSLTVSPEPHSRKRKRAGASQSLNAAQHALELGHPRNRSVFANPPAGRLHAYAYPRFSSMADTSTSRPSISNQSIFPPLRQPPVISGIIRNLEPAPVEIEDDDDEDVFPSSMVDPSGNTDDDYTLPMLGREEPPIRLEPPLNDREKRLSVLREVQLGSSLVTAGKSVELEDGTFLRVQDIIRRPLGGIILQGRHLVRQSNLRPMMPDRMNEVVWMSNITQDCFNEKKLPTPFETPLAKARKVRQIVFTNASFNDMHDMEVVSNSHDARVTDGSLLFCRWKNLKIFSGRNRVEEELRTLWSHECDDKARGRPDNPKLSSVRRRQQWYGNYTLGGSGVSRGPVAMINGQTAVAKQAQKYSFGDAFCGAGGASCGADMAGLHVDWGFDQDEKAVEAYRANFDLKGTRCIQKDVFDFLLEPQLGSFHVDILHMSFPCQAFSAANTTPNEAKDAQNQAPIFSCGPLLAGIRPRVATVEEADGLFSRHRPFFDALICQFVDAGYSVRWAVLRCDAYGVPQGRRRVCINAAGPGEELPRFPPPTYGDVALGRNPFATINQKIRDIPATAPNHDTNCPFKNGVVRPPFLGDAPAKTVTCHGGMNNYHPSGLRQYTVRELACLQTFPTLYQFVATQKTVAKRQVGNALPPKMACAWYREIVKCLKETDGVTT